MNVQMIWEKHLQRKKYLFNWNDHIYIGLMQQNVLFKYSKHIWKLAHPTITPAKTTKDIQTDQSTTFQASANQPDAPSDSPSTTPFDADDDRSHTNEDPYHSNETHHHSDEDLPLTDDLTDHNHHAIYDSDVDNDDQFNHHDNDQYNDRDDDHHYDLEDCLDDYHYG